MTEQHAAGPGKTSAPKKPRRMARPAADPVGHNNPPEPIDGDDKVRVSIRFGDEPEIDVTETLPKMAEQLRAVNGQSDDRLRLLIERIERLEEERKGIADDIKDVFGEAKATGYDVKTMRRVLRLRKMNPDDRREAEAILETYCRNLGMPCQGSLF